MSRNRSHPKKASAETLTDRTLIMPGSSKNSPAANKRTSWFRSKSLRTMSRSLPFIFTLSCFLIFTWIFGPETTFQLGPVIIPSLILFFAFIFLLSFLLVFFITSRKRHGILFALYLTSTLILKYTGFLNWLYFFFLTAMFILLEIALHKSTPKRSLPGNIG